MLAQGRRVVEILASCTQVLEDAIAEHRQRLESGPPVISQDEAAELTHEELEEAVRMMEQVARVHARKISRAFAPLHRHTLLYEP